MSVFRRFEDIDAWKKARTLVIEIYSLTREGAFALDYGLKDQIQRAAVSIGSNIAEGYARRGNKEFVNFLWIARGSAAEVCSQLYNVRDLGYAPAAKCKELYDLASLISSQIYALIQSLMPNISHQRLQPGDFNHDA